MLFPGALGAPAHRRCAEHRCTAMPPVVVVPLLSQRTPYPSAYMAPPAWSVYMPSYPPRPQQSSTQSERELLAESRTKALNLNAVRDAETRSAFPSGRSSRTLAPQEQALIKPERVSSQATSQRSLSFKKGFFSGIKVTNMVTSKTVKPPPARPRIEQDKTGRAQKFKAMMQDMIKSSLTEFGVIPKAELPPPTTIRIRVNYSGQGIPSSHRFI